MFHLKMKKVTASLLTPILASSILLTHPAYAESSMPILTSVRSASVLEASVERQSNDMLTISWHSDAPITRDVNIYWSKTPDYFPNDHLLKTVSSTNSVIINDPNPSSRTYFMVSTGGLRVTTAERKVNLEGAYNFRDLGGYATSDGHKVKWGSLFRSEQLSSLTEADKQYLLNSGLKTVVDYRSDGEIAAAPDPVMDGVKEVKDPVTQDTNGAMNTSTLLSMMPEQAVDVFAGFQRSMVEQPQVGAYKTLFELLLDPNNLALVQHCTAGKDRTGLGSALILLALGVPEDTIMSDYLLSNTYRAEANAAQLAALSKQMNLPLDSNPMKVMAILMGVQKEFLQASLDQIKVDYGSYDGFFQNALGLSQQDLQKLQAMYLENTDPIASNDLLAVVERGADNSLNISWSSSAPIVGDAQVYWSETSNNFSKDNFLQTGWNGTSINVSDPNPGARSYFMIVADGRIATAAERKVNLQGAHNFRDLGGYATTDGHTVKWGALYRAEQLNGLTAADKQYLVNSGLKTVVDYRSDSEIATAQDPVINSVNEVKAPVTQDVSSAMNMSSITSPESAVTAFEGFQKLMVQEPMVGAYKTLFQLLLDPNNQALVQHCTAGKDRTGLGSALILLALGVPEDTIINDYLLSNTYNAASNQQQLAMLPASMQPIYAVFLGVQKEFLQASLDQIKADNGSYDNFFKNVLGLSAQDRQKLKDMYVVNAIQTGFVAANYSDDVVSASVHSNVYATNPTLSIYDSAGSLIQMSSVVSSTYTYSVTNATYTYNYLFSANIGSSYRSVSLHENVTGTASVTVNISESQHEDAGASGASVALGGSNPAVVQADSSTLSVPENGKIDGAVLAASLKQHDAIKLEALGSSVLIPVSALADFAGSEKTIQVQSGGSSYVLPLSILKLDALAKALSTDAVNLFIQVIITNVTDNEEADLKSSAASLGVTTFGPALDFQVNAVDIDGKSIPVSLGNTYVSRSISLADTIDSTKATGALFDPVSKKLTFVPTVFSVTNGSTTATLKRNGSSIYTIVQSNKSFADIANHWSKASIELMANKLLVDGVSANQFEPDRSITRAEFVAIISRSLALTQRKYQETFVDVSTEDWFADALEAVVSAGIIKGYEDKTFRPNEPIHREELAAMVIRAMAYAGVKSVLSLSEQDAVLSKFQDNKNIGWARQEVAAAVHAGILNGMTETTIAGSESASRAQAVSMLNRFLVSAKFIN